jgi:hypothetical protein
MRALAGPRLFVGVAFSRGLLAVLVLAALLAGAAADPLKTGAVIVVKPNLIWFEDASKLAQWQSLKKAGDEAALHAYQDRVLKEREAWQFLKPLTVKILRYEAATNQVNVEMKTAGRMQGTTWWLDASTVGP